MKYFFFPLSLLFISSLDAQPVYHQKDTDEDFEITRFTETEIIEAWLDENDYQNILFSEQEDDSYLIQVKKGGWFIYRHDIKLHRKSYDSIAFVASHDIFALVKNRNQYFLLGQDLNKSVRFENIRLIPNNGTYANTDFIVLAKVNSLWGQYDPTSETFVNPPVFKSFKDVPQVSSWSSNFADMRKHLNIDIIIPDPYNGDGIYKGRSATTKKWGMFQHMGSIDTLIPFAYDSLYFYGWNGMVTTVFDGGKAGFYPWRGEGTPTPCIYEDFQRLTYEMTDLYGHPREYLHMAVKKGEKWAIIDWYTGKLLTDFVYDSSHIRAVFYLPKSEYYTSY